MGRAAAITATLLLVVAGCDASWTQFGFGPGNTRSTSDSSINLVNVDTLIPDWTASTGGITSSSPAIADGVAYVGSANGKVFAFSADAATACGGEPTTCTPLWTASTGGAVLSSPAVSGGLVFVGSNDGKLYAFDAAGSSGCSGTPKVCAPVWTAVTGGAVASSPTVADGVVYVGSDDGNLYAFSAVGTARCSGSPLVCQPRWIGSTGGSVRSTPAVAGGTVFVGSADSELYAFDANGIEGCSGSPLVCAPRWTGETGGAITGSPAVADGKVFVGSADAKLYAFDAGGAAGCSGLPAVCSPLWTMSTGGPIGSSPAIAGRDLFVGSDDGHLYGVDVGSTSACSGVPKTCPPRWSAAVGSPVRSSPAVAGGVVFVGSSEGDLQAFDAGGGLGCTGTAPVVCSSVWSARADLGIRSSPVVSRGRVYVGSDDAHLYAFRATGSTTPVPPVVTAPRAIPGDGEVTVRWTRPTRVDLPIAGFTIQPYRDGVALHPISVGPNASSYTVTGLTGSPSYSFTVSVTVAGVVGAASPLSDGEAPSADLAPSAYEGTPTHDGTKRGEPLPTMPSLQWSKTFDHKVSYPVVADGRVFVTVSDDPTGTLGARLFAFDQATGTPLWGPVPLGVGVAVAGLAYEDHHVYTQLTNGVLQAHDEATGSEVWGIDLPGQSLFTGPPIAYRGLVYTEGAGIGSTAYAVDGQTGELLWTAGVGNGRTSPAADATGVYLSYGCTGANRLDRDTGTRLWNHTTGCIGGGGYAPVVAGGRVYVRDLSGGPVILDQLTGDPIGSFVSGPIPAVDGTTRFAMLAGTLSAVDTTTGQALWSRVADGTLVSAPFVVDGVVVVGGSYGLVQAYDKVTGTSAWSLNVGAPVLAPNENSGVNLPGMASDDGRLFVSATNSLVAIG